MHAWVYGYLAGFTGLIGAAVGLGALIGKYAARLALYLIRS
jgi:hypothetical protein